MKKFFIQVGGIIAAICIVYCGVFNSIKSDVAKLVAYENGKENKASSTKSVIVPYLNIDINEVMRGEKVYVRNQKAVKKDESVSTDTDRFIRKAVIAPGTINNFIGESNTAEWCITSNLGLSGANRAGYSEDSADVGNAVEVNQESEAVPDNYESSDSGESEPVSEDYISEDGTGEPVSELVESGTDDYIGETGAENYSTGDDGEFDSIQTVSESGLTYLGNWTITAYCPCESCCGAYSSGYTASGTLATAGRTIACNILPIGTQVMVDGHVYTVEDTGWSPYEQWIDIFFDSHDEALAFGEQQKEVYLVE